VCIKYNWDNAQYNSVLLWLFPGVPAKYWIVCSNVYPFHSLNTVNWRSSLDAVEAPDQHPGSKHMFRWTALHAMCHSTKEQYRHLSSQSGSEPRCDVMRTFTSTCVMRIVHYWESCGSHILMPDVDKRKVTVTTVGVWWHKCLPSCTSVAPCWFLVSLPSFLPSFLPLYPSFLFISFLISCFLYLNSLFLIPSLYSFLFSSPPLTLYFFLNFPFLTVSFLSWNVGQPNGLDFTLFKNLCSVTNRIWLLSQIQQLVSRIVSTVSTYTRY